MKKLLALLVAGTMVLAASGCRKRSSDADAKTPPMGPEAAQALESAQHDTKAVTDQAKKTADEAKKTVDEAKKALGK